jgi:hypothetical protein
MTSSKISSLESDLIYVYNKLSKREFLFVTESKNWNELSHSKLKIEHFAGTVQGGEVEDSPPECPTATATAGDPNGAILPQYLQYI